MEIEIKKEIVDLAISIIEKEQIVKEKIKQEQKNTRNYYIDVLKGIAIISVILIHTAFHSGTSYVPSWFANFTVLFEVPMFFFLAGWSYAHSKNNKSYVQNMVITQIKYMIFICLMFIAIKITNQIAFSNNQINLNNLINWFLHTYSNMSPFSGVEYSLWFFRVYLFVGSISAMIITLIKPKIVKCIIMICFIGIFIITFFTPKIGMINLGIELSYILFYMLFYTLGYYTKDKELSFPLFVILFVLNVLTLIGIYKVIKINIINIQAHKFLPNFIFLIWSLFGVYIVLVFKKYFNSCKKNILSIIGQHSMYIFLAQGVGSSVLYWISKYIVMEWYYKIWIMFGINILVTIVVTLLLKLILDPIGKNMKKILNEKICR